MNQTTRLALPFIAPEQAQKHITHNEALLELDALVQLRLSGREKTTPPIHPYEGDVFALGDAPDGAWDGEGGKLALWTQGGWRFLTAHDGWLAWDAAEGALLVRRDGAWRPVFADVSRLGIGTTADTINRLAVRTEAALFTAIPDADGGNGNLRLTLNKEGVVDSGTLMFQSGFSGRAEVGLAGNDDFALKISADGAEWRTALTVEAATGFVRFAQITGAQVSSPTIDAGVLTVATGTVLPVSQSGTSDEIETISGGFDGALLVLMGSDGISLTLRDGTGNLKLGVDRALDGAGDVLMLIRRGGDWIEMSYAANS